MDTNTLFKTQVSQRRDVLKFSIPYTFLRILQICRSIGVPVIYRPISQSYTSWSLYFSLLLQKLLKLCSLVFIYLNIQLLVYFWATWGVEG